jgi:hypothetical protein
MVAWAARVAVQAPVVVVVVAATALVRCNL